jgi:hypothetical protein
MTDEELSKLVEEGLKKYRCLMNISRFQNYAEKYFGEKEGERLSLYKDYSTAYKLVREVMVNRIKGELNEFKFIKICTPEISQVFIDGFNHWIDKYFYFVKSDHTYPFIRHANDSSLYGIYMEEDELFQLLKGINECYLNDIFYEENKELKEALINLEKLIKKDSE